MDHRTYRERVKDARLTPEASRDLTRAVMARTTGNPCARAQGLLADHVDGALERTTAQILDEHLAHCAGCQDLHGALVELGRVLPTLAELPVDEGFARRVVLATSRRERPRRIPAGEWRAWWGRVLERPRFSLEVAYVATVLFVLVAGNPALLADAMAERAQAMAAKTTATLSVQASDLQQSLSNAPRVRAVESWLDSARRGVDAGRSIAQGWTQAIAGRVRQAWGGLRSWAAELFQRVRSLAGA